MTDFWRLTILITAAGYELISAIVAIFNEQKNKVKKWMLITLRFIVSAGIVWLIADDVKTSRKEKIAKEIEVAVKEKDSLISSLTGKFSDTKDASLLYPLIILGGHEFISFGDFAGSSIITITPSLKIEVRNNQINIYADIMNARGDMIAKIRDRNWEIVDPSIIEYNNDSNRLEIISGENPIFQVELRKDTIIINGLLYNVNRTALVFTQIGAGKKILIPYGNTQRFYIPENYSLPIFFRYPRKSWLGILDTPGVGYYQ